MVAVRHGVAPRDDARLALELDAVVLGDLLLDALLVADLDLPPAPAEGAAARRAFRARRLVEGLARQRRRPVHVGRPAAVEALRGPAARAEREVARREHGLELREGVVEALGRVAREALQRPRAVGPGAGEDAGPPARRLGVLRPRELEREHEQVAVHAERERHVDKFEEEVLGDARLVQVARAEEVDVGVDDLEAQEADEVEGHHRDAPHRALEVRDDPRDARGHVEQQERRRQVPDGVQDHPGPVGVLRPGDGVLQPHAEEERRAEVEDERGRGEGPVRQLRVLDLLVRRQRVVPEDAQHVQGPERHAGAQAPHRVEHAPGEVPVAARLEPVRRARVHKGRGVAHEHAGRQDRRHVADRVGPVPDPRELEAQRAGGRDRDEAVKRGEAPEQQVEPAAGRRVARARGGSARHALHRVVPLEVVLAAVPVERLRAVAAAVVAFRVAVPFDGRVDAALMRRVAPGAARRDAAGQHDEGSASPRHNAAPQAGFFESVTSSSSSARGQR